MSDCESERSGDRLHLPCKGGPSRCLVEHFPPRCEIDERGGVYVLVDEGQDGRYLFVPDGR